MTDDKQLIEDGMDVILGMDGCEDDRRAASTHFIQLVRQHWEKHFIEQACEAVDEAIIDYRKKVKTIDHEYDEAKEVYGMLTAKQAIRDKFNSR